MPGDRRRIWLGIFALLWAASIFASSSSVVTVRQLSSAVTHAAAGHISDDSFRRFWAIAWWVFVKGWHAFEFAILYTLVRAALTKRPILAAVVAALYAISDEGHQLIVPDRGCRASDVCIDWLGILGAVALRWWLARPREQRRRQTPAAIAIAALWVLGVYLLSVFPFGLITLGPTHPSSYSGARP